MWQHSKNQIVTKLKNFNCEKLKNSNCDKTQKLKMSQNSKSQIVTKLKNSKCDKLNFGTKLILWQHFKRALTPWQRGQPMRCSQGSFLRFSRCFINAQGVFQWYRCFYPHRSRESVSPVCGIFCMPLSSQPETIMNTDCRQP